MAGRDRWWPWVGGVLLGLIFMGPGLRSGALFNLDLIITPDIPVPGGVWGLGPELPRRVPFMVPVAWLSALLPGSIAGKAFLVALVAVAFAGAARLLPDADTRVRLAAAVLYGGSPFLLTRISTGYLGVAAAAAVLPWAAPALLAPSTSVRRTLRWAIALGFCGVAGGLLAGVAVVVGLACESKRRIGPVVLAVLLGQLPWLVPGVVVLRQGIHPATGSVFATRVPGAGGTFRLLAGHGFWQDALQLGGGGVLVAVAGAALLALAVLGHGSLPAAWRRPLAILAGVGVVVALLSAVPWVDDRFVDFTGTAVGAPLRESQRLLPLYLVWMAPAAALGGRRLAAMVRAQGLARVVAVVPLLIGLGLAAPALWGAEGQLSAVDVPDEWESARAAVHEHPGTVVAFPWAQYYNLNIADGRRVNVVFPLYFGGDVLTASDPNVGAEASERADPREQPMDLTVLQLRDGDHISGRLAELGVRWVVLSHDIDWQTYGALRDDPGLDPVVAGPTLELWEVTGWQGAVVTDDGIAVDLDPVVAPLAGLDGSGRATAARPGADGWRRGVHAAAVTEDGLLRLPAGRGYLWYWPTVVVLTADALVLAVLWVARPRRARLDS